MESFSSLLYKAAKTTPLKPDYKYNYECQILSFSILLLTDLENMFWYYSNIFYSCRN